MAEYIERKALIQRLKNSPLFTNFGEDGFFICNGVIDIIKKQPSVKSAADVVEVRHGRWLNTDSLDAHYSPIYKCSECWKDVADHYVGNHKYCLHCGARMDGKDDNDG